MNSRVRKMLESALNNRILLFVASLEVLAMAIKFGTQVTIARLAGAHAFGVYTYAMTWASTLAIPAGLGMSAMVIRYVPRYLAKNEHARLAGLLSFTRNWTWTASVTLAGVAAAALLIFKRDEVSTTTFLALVLIPLLAVNMLQAEILRASGRIIVSRIIPIIVQPSTILVAVFAWWSFAHLDQTSALACTAIGLALTFSLQWIYIRGSFRRNTHGVGKEFDRRAWFGLSFHLLLIKAAQLVLNNSDILIVGLILGPLEAGIYAACVKTATLASIVTQAVNLAVPPEIARLAALEQWKSVEDKTRTSARFAFLPSALLAGVIIVAAPQLLGIFGTEFKEGVSCLIVLTLARLVTAWTGPVGSMLNVTGHQKTSIRVYTLAAAIQLALVYILTPQWGILGAAVGSACAMIFWNFVLCARAMQLLNIRLWPLPTR
ncbi:oligosaccharide flippase family protein [Nocardioides sp. AE5]|uniref:lipopolysaccharide biosynthesis protein n=1 Tax=Nocardioides sp. AE5 TaxID=2962573 RepID=UPI00288151C5|nr:oligosaccharide flippase family protein [Nocardioides sp. AE5]MDT0202635.1 polysaccharide biosynthesis C-terminal domain-containing protein [Nocardioides sp. AE5]